MLLGIAIALMATAIAVHLQKRLSFAYLPQKFVVKHLPDSDTLTIGIIGDSWVSYQKLDRFLHTALLQKGITAKIISAGRDGARSKQILQWLMAEDGNAFNHLLQQQPQYCIVVAGINDAQSYVGAQNYAHHMGLIVQLLHRYHIQPIIVALPWFDTEAAQKNIGRPRKWRNRICAQINHESNNNIAAYRHALSRQLQLQNADWPVMQCSFDELCKDASGCKPYYSDALHLNAAGRALIANLLANSLAKNLIRR